MRFGRHTLICLLVVVATVPALAWPPGTHAYIAAHAQPGADPVNVMYGAMAPDVNQLLSSDQLSPYFFATHYPAGRYAQQGFPDLWYSAQAMNTPASRSLGVGFASHNERWGADYFAHLKSRTYPNYRNAQYPHQNGYVWVKADQLCPLMKSQLSAQGIDSPLLNALLADSMNCHFIVEYGMDLLLKQTMDPEIGAKVLAAAQTHDEPTMQTLLAISYFEPSGLMMAGYDPYWSGILAQYGAALDLPMDQAVPAVAAFLEVLAENQILQTTLDDATRAQLTAVIQLGLVDSMQLCAADYEVELTSTVHLVGARLAEQGITY